jgi:hypothetical protein
MQKQEQNSRNNCWYQLDNFPRKLFSNQDSVISFVTNPQKSWICKIKNREIVSSDVHLWMSLFGLKFSQCIVFYRHGPAYEEPPHVDFENFSITGEKIFYSASINIELFGNSKVRFFNGDPHTGTYAETLAEHVPYISFNGIPLGDIIDESDYNPLLPYLMRTDVIHGVTGINDEPRMLASFRFTNLENKILSWQECLERFEDCLIAR